ncbi:MAG: hypothetical protein EOP85_04970, partial [Verrucomicrobiaceae bacterium]
RPRTMDDMLTARLLSACFRGLVTCSVALGFSVAALAAPSISLNKESHAPGETIVVSFSGGPGNASDWIGIYTDGITPNGNPQSLAWYYTNGTKTASGNLTQGTVNFPNTGLGPGTYKVFFLANDGYAQLTAPIPLVITSLVPPVWRVESFRPRHAVTGTAYSVKISAWATPGTPRTFSKVDGPAWLDVSADGMLSGTPAESDAGLHEVHLRVTGGSGGQPSDVTVQIDVKKSGQEDIGSLRVMSYNVWKEWSQVSNGFQKGIESIVKSGADVVGLQESSQSLAQSMADELGWYRSTATGSSQIISRYPIQESFSAGLGVGARVRLTTDPQCDVNVVNCHLDYLYYGPYAAQVGGATPQSVLTEELRSQRDSQMATVLQNLNTRLAAADNIPVVMTGDFNCPSHLDWTAAAASAHSGVGPVAWPVTTRIIAAGMKDSFREIHPDPVAVPGITWSSIHKGSEPQDRIDFVYFKGQSVKPVASEVYATPVEVTVGPWGGDVTPVAGNTWPSDHLAVLTTFTVAAVDADANGLSDAWERRFFGSTGVDPLADPNHDGLNNFASMVLAVDPNGSPSVALDTATASATGVVSFKVSAHGRGRGVALQRSDRLDSWETLWRHDADPLLLDPNLRNIVEEQPGQWSLGYQDDAAEDGSRFYRLHYIGQ